MKIKTNNRPRDLVALYELPESVAAESFGYVFPDSEDAYTDRFFEYRGSWYDTHEFERATGDFQTLAYDAVQHESVFSAVAFRYVEDYERVKVAYIHW